MDPDICTWHLRQALLPEGWRHDVRVIARGGIITSVQPGVPGAVGDRTHAIALPGIANLHSHAFQRAMSGLAERRGIEDNNFWGWREAMYRFALLMTPDQLQAVAAQAYAEMLEAGFTRVGEFHYLHHAPDGRAYGDVAEMGTRIVAAAQTAGIGLTLLPVFYAHSGFGGLPATAEQRRFVCKPDVFSRLAARASEITAGLEGANTGIAPHSLRAVTPDELAILTGLAGHGSLHIHVAEQGAEVVACLAWSGARPVEWLLDNAEISAEWCLIHATHMTGNETRRLAATGATVGLCPITEANLGDGLFNAIGFTGHGGRFGVGTDSNVEISLAGELRLLEYGQRLAIRSRNILAAPAGSTGRALFDHALHGGAAALGQPRCGIQPGAAADIVTLQADALALLGRDGDALLDALVFSGRPLVDCVYTRARLAVRNGAHLASDDINRRFRTAMQQLLGA